MASGGEFRDDPDTVHLLAEDLSVGTELRETGRVQVKVVTHQREEDGKRK